MLSPTSLPSPEVSGDKGGDCLVILPPPVGNLIIRILYSTASVFHCHVFKMLASAAATDASEATGRSVLVLLLGHTRPLVIDPEALLGSNSPPLLPSMAVVGSLLTSTTQNSLDT